MDWRLPIRFCGQIERSFTLQRQSTKIAQPWLQHRACRALAPGARLFTTRSLRFQDAAAQVPESATPKTKPSRIETPNASKRARRKKRALAAKVPAAKTQDAEVSHLRGLVYGPSQSRDPRIKVGCSPSAGISFFAKALQHVTAWCVAEAYNLEQVQELLQQNGITIQPAGSILSSEETEVIHVTLPFPSTFESMAPASAPVATGDVFIFSSGTVVAWGVPSSEVRDLTERMIRAAARRPLGDNAETEDLEYIEDDQELRSFIREERVILGIRAITSASEDAFTPKQKLNSEMKIVFAKIAFSSGIARAAEISVLENRVEDYSLSTRAVLSALAGEGRLRMGSVKGVLNAIAQIPQKMQDRLHHRGRSQLLSREHIYKSIAELLDLRAQLNLYSKITDDLPDILWDTSFELHMEDYYDQVKRALDLGTRIRALNQKIDYSQSIVHELRDFHSEKHSSFLEKTIIWLITVEILLVLWTEGRNGTFGDHVKTLARGGEDPGEEHGRGRTVSL